MDATTVSGQLRPFLAARLMLVAALWACAAGAQTPPSPAGPQNVKSWTCGLEIAASSGTTVTLNYSGLPGNQPMTYGNFVAIWPSSIIAWWVAPTARQKVGANLQDGSYTLTDLSISMTPYSLGYSVGPDITDICASAMLNDDGTNGPVDAVSIAISAVDANSISVRFHCLDGYQPKLSGNWIGLWTGRATPYYAPDPLAQVAISQNSTDGIAVLNNVTLTSGIPYTLVYFLGADRTTAAAIVTFTMP